MKYVCHYYLSGAGVKHIGNRTSKHELIDNYVQSCLMPQSLYPIWRFLSMAEEEARRRYWCSRSATIVEEDLILSDIALSALSTQGATAAVNFYI